MEKGELVLEAGEIKFNNPQPECYLQRKLENLFTVFLTRLRPSLPALQSFFDNSRQA